MWWWACKPPCRVGTRRQGPLLSFRCGFKRSNSGHRAYMIAAFTHCANSWFNWSLSLITGILADVFVITCPIKEE